MIRLGRVVASCALAVLLAACSDLPPIFEDVGANPHPPELTLLGIGVGIPEPPPEPPAPTTAAATDTPRSVTYLPPDAVVAVRPNDSNANSLALRVAYADAGADLSEITVRDLDGPNSGSLELPEFPGTSGILEAAIAFDPMSVPGPHRLEIWAQDAKESRSAKTSFTVIVEIF
jgi:hypothetical protein